MESRTTTPMMFDEFALKHGGMLATNGHSLYKSRDVIMDCLDHILECTHTSQHPITIADVGTSDGSTSAALLNEVIGKIRCHTGKSRQLMIYYTDQQTNDFNRMFNVINGGYLVVLNIGTTKQGEVSVPIKGGYNTLSHVLRNLLADDIITKEEFLDCNLNAELYRTEEDYALPFRDNAKDLSETGLELVSTRSFAHKLDHPSFAVSNKDDATKKVYADRIVAGIKPWLYGCIYKGLSCKISQQERESLVEIYFSRLWDFAYKNDNQTPQMGLIEVVARKRV